MPVDAERPAGADELTGSDPFALRGELRREELPQAVPELPVQAQPLAALPKGVPGPPAPCQAYATRKPAGEASCADEAAGRAALDEALAISEAAKRDAALAALEACAGLPPGLARALRAELAPPECGDAIVASLAGEPPEGIHGALHQTLVGLALAGRLARTAGKAPAIQPPFTKKRVAAHIEGPMGQWVREQAAAIQEIASRGAKLRGYAQAVVAVEAGMADMRFVLAARAVPVPEEIAQFPEAVETYHQNLELSLDARKQRGRDAALVGLGQLAQQGVIRDERLDRARGMLAQVYGGSAIKTLDALALPPLEPAEPKSADERLATRLPSFYAGLVLPAEVEARMLRMLLEQGLPLPQRIAFAKAELGPEQKLLVARARIDMAQNYWRAVDVDEAVAALSSLPSRSDDADMLLAVGLALRGGPANAADMILRAPVAELGIGDVGALDHIAAGDGPFAATAAFDAALVVQLATPADADAAAWRALSERFRKAAARVQPPRMREEAERRAREADETAAAIAASSGAP
jgi:hypothetical protein